MAELPGEADTARELADQQGRSAMSLSELLRESGDDLVNGAVAELRQARLEHYEGEGNQALRQRLGAILELTLSSIETGHAEEIVEWAARVAHERFSAGYDLFELQTAINILEEAFWKRLLASRSPEELAHDLGLVISVLGIAKDELARAYVALARQQAGSSAAGNRRY
jgi:hypothetical protein